MTEKPEVVCGHCGSWNPTENGLCRDCNRRLKVTEAGEIVWREPHEIPHCDHNFIEIGSDDGYSETVLSTLYECQKCGERHIMKDRVQH